MPKPILIEHGPPGHKGVDTIMGVGHVGDDELAELDRVDDALSKATWAGIGIWVLGVAIDKPTVRGAGIGAVAVALIGKHLK